MRHSAAVASVQSTPQPAQPTTGPVRCATGRSASTRSSSARAWPGCWPPASSRTPTTASPSSIATASRRATEHRRAVPQGRHAHGLQLGGQQAIEQLLPGFRAEAIAARRAAPARRRARCASPRRHRLAARPGRPLTAPSPAARCSRASSAAACARSRTSPCASTAACSSSQPRRPRDRRARDRAVARGEETLRADLVVAASGRGGRVPAWLEAMGYERPAEDRVDVDIMYASRNLRLRPGALGDDKIVLNALIPGRPRGMAMLVERRRRWNVTLYGYGDAHHPPTDTEGFNAFAATVTDPDVRGDRAGRAGQRDRHARLPGERPPPLREAAPLPRGPARHRRRDVQLQPDLRPGHDGRHAPGGRAAALPARGWPSPARKALLQGRARPVDHAWKLSTGGDLALPEVERTRGAARPRHQPLHGAAARDRRARQGRRRTFFEVTGMLTPPTRLLTPAIAARAGRPRGGPDAGSRRGRPWRGADGTTSYGSQ